MFRRWNGFWESLCTRCGRCCFMKTVDGERILFHLDSPCRDYDRRTRSCLVYETRFTDNRKCRKMTLRKAMFASYLHDSCGYVQWASRCHIRFARKLHPYFLDEDKS